MNINVLYSCTFAVASGPAYTIERSSILYLTLITYTYILTLITHTYSLSLHTHKYSLSLHTHTDPNAAMAEDDYSVLTSTATIGLSVAGRWSRALI